MKENIINYIPLKIYRCLRWEKKQHKVYKRTTAYHGEAYAQMCYDAEKAIFQKKPKDEILALLKKRDVYILQNIEQKCECVIRNAASYQVREEHPRSGNEPIWVFWWTGEETAPDIVKACIRSIRRNANGHKVVFLSKQNIHEYVALPPYIEEKHDKGIIGHAHYSDMIRLSLLNEYGGVWIDATVFISQPLPDALFEEKFYTAKSVDNTAFYFSRSRWVGYFLAGAKAFALFSFVRDMLFTYWQHTDDPISYLIMDYMFEIACRHIPEVGETMAQLPDNNLARGQLMNKINEPYSPELFDELERGSTFLSKLSWRYGNPVPVTKTGQKTNYGHLLEL